MKTLFKYLISILLGCVVFISCSNYLRTSTKQVENLVFIANGGTYTQPYYKGERKPYNIFNYIEKYLNRNISLADKRLYYQIKDTFLLRFHVDNLNQITYVVCDEKKTICNIFKECLNTMATDSLFLQSNTNHITNHKYKIYVIDKNR